MNIRAFVPRRRPGPARTTRRFPARFPLFLAALTVLPAAFPPTAAAQGFQYPLAVGDMWIYDTESASFALDTFAVAGDTVMPNGKTYAVIRHRQQGSWWMARDTPTYRRQEGEIVYQYHRVPGKEFPMVNFSADSLQLVGRNPLWFGSTFVDTMSVRYLGRRQDSVFGAVMTGRQFAFDASHRALDDEFVESIVDGIGPVKVEYSNTYPRRLVGALIGGVSYGLLVDVAEYPARPLPLPGRVLNHPEPFNASTTLSFDLEGSSSVSITVFDLLGRRVLEEDLGVLPPGPHRYLFRGDRLTSGVYFSRVRLGADLLRGRMTLVR